MLVIGNSGIVVHQVFQVARGAVVCDRAYAIGLTFCLVILLIVARFEKNVCEELFTKSKHMLSQK